MGYLVFYLGHNQIALAFFFSTMFNRSRFALVLVFLVVLCSVIISLVMDRLFATSAPPSAYFLWPPFAFYRALGKINRATLYASTMPYKMSRLASDDELITIFWYLLCEIPVFLGLTYYLQSVLPSEFGVRKPWHFPITEPIKYFKAQSKLKNNGGIRTRSEFDLAVAIKIDENEMKFEDQDVKDERAKITDPQFSSEEYPLIMKNMRKVYPGRGGQGPKLAVKDVTIGIKKGVTFGLLGPK
jgi:hypothetical protein